MPALCAKGRALIEEKTRLWGVAICRVLTLQSRDPEWPSLHAKGHFGAPKGHPPRFLGIP
jgi:hypothetical protein